MELDQQQNQDNSILNYDENSLLVAGKKYSFPCFISQNEIIKFDNFDLEKDIKELQKISKNIDFLIIGSKNTYPAKQQVMIKQVVNNEFMNIASSIYSFNLMLSDNRNSALLIL